jgi:hypothetical protein
LTSTLDTEGYFSETVYDLAGKVRIPVKMTDRSGRT